MIETPDAFTVALKMIGSLSLVLMILFGFFYGLKQLSQRDILGSKGKLIQVLATHYLGGKKSIAIFKIPGTFFVVGITNDQINLLACFKEEEWPQIPLPNGNVEEENSFLSTLFKTSLRNEKPGDRS
jgi:flagellar biogenesis protein FliO